MKVCNSELHLIYDTAIEATKCAGLPLFHT